jgi:nucleoside-diphosphate-sugar epimerase
VYAIDRAARLLAFHPAIRLDEGVPRAVAWYRSQGLL